jgi:hypothetical protein
MTIGGLGADALPVRATNFVPCGIHAPSPIDTTAEQAHRVEIENSS